MWEIFPICCQSQWGSLLKACKLTSNYIWLLPPFCTPFKWPAGFSKLLQTYLESCFHSLLNQGRVTWNWAYRFSFKHLNHMGKGHPTNPALKFHSRSYVCVGVPAFCHMLHVPYRLHNCNQWLLFHLLVPWSPLLPQPLILWPKCVLSYCVLCNMMACAVTTVCKYRVLYMISVVHNKVNAQSWITWDFAFVESNFSLLSPQCEFQSCHWPGQPMPLYFGVVSSKYIDIGTCWALSKLLSPRSSIA